MQESLDRIKPAAKSQRGCPLRHLEQECVLLRQRLICLGCLKRDGRLWLYFEPVQIRLEAEYESQLRGLYGHLNTNVSVMRPISDSDYRTYFVCPA